MGRGMTVKTDSKGILIADRSGETASMAHGIEPVHNDTSAILKLLTGGARSASVMKRQRVSSPPQAVTAAVQRSTSGAVTSAVQSALAQSRGQRRSVLTSWGTPSLLLIRQSPRRLRRGTGKAKRDLRKPHAQVM